MNRTNFLLAATLAYLVTALPAAAVPLDDVNEPPMPKNSPLDRARVKVENDRARLERDTSNDADRAILDADEARLNSDIHDLSALVRKAKRPDDGQSRLPIETD